MRDGFRPVTVSRDSLKEEGKGEGFRRNEGEGKGLQVVEQKGEGEGEVQF